MGASTVDWFFRHSLVIFCPPKIYRSGDKDSSIHNKQKSQLELKQEVWKSYYRVVEVKNVLFTPRKSNLAFLLQN